MFNKKKKYRKINETGESRLAKRVQNSETKNTCENRKSRQITGICFIFAGIIFFTLSLLSNAEGALTKILSSWTHLCFGVCTYIFPFVLIAIGIVIFVDKNSKVHRNSFIAGSLVFFIGFISLVGIMTPINVLSNQDTTLLFSNVNLISYGGYLGNSIAWLLLTLFGKVISAILCVLIMAIGFIIGGFSYTNFKNSVLHFLKRGEHPEETNDNFDVSDIQFDKQGNIDTSSFERFAPAKTTVLSRWQEKMSKKINQSKPATRLATQDDLDKTKEVESAGVTKQLTRKISQTNDDLQKLKQSDENNKLTTNDANKQPEIMNTSKDDSYLLPSFDLLTKPKKLPKSKSSEKALISTARELQRTLQEFGVQASVVGWTAGPTVTLYKVELPAGVRVNKIQNLGTDLALALAAISVRIFAPIPGTNYVGIEVPNANRETVLLSDVLKDAKTGPLQIAIGKDVEGKSVVSNLATMPHLLIGGTTGSGKSVSVNAMIMSILMRSTPSEVRLILIDPKRVEFTPYNGIPHLYVPVVTEPSKAASALSWAVAEMENRLRLMSEVSARNITEYNNKVDSGQLDSENPLTEDEQKVNKHTHLPYIVIVIDELADLMMNVGKEVEMSICRLAQLARAAGIHLIVATQRPSTNVVTGLIKSNITNRIAFNVASSIDSRVILDTTGAEDLIGLGDLLLSKPELARPVRIQGCFVSEQDISNVVNFIKTQGEPEYNNDILSSNTITLGDLSPSPAGTKGQDDELVWEAADIVVTSGLGSTSNLQRRLKVGYSRAGRIMDQLEEKGIVGPANGSKPREVLVDALELESLKVFEHND